MPAKKIAWFLVAMGAVTFFLGVYQLNARPDSFSVAQLFTFAGLTAISLILIGLGGYLAGYWKDDARGRRFTLDFSKKIGDSSKS